MSGRTWAKEYLKLSGPNSSGLSSDTGMSLVGVSLWKMEQIEGSILSNISE